MVLQLQKYFPYYHFINPIDQNNTIACLWPVVTVSGSNVFCCMNENKLWTLSKNSNLSTYVYTLINFQSLTTLRNRENNPRGPSAFILSKSCNVQGGRVGRGRGWRDWPYKINRFRKAKDIHKSRLSFYQCWKLLWCGCQNNLWTCLSTQVVRSVLIVECWYQVCLIDATKSWTSNSFSCPHQP